MLIGDRIRRLREDRGLTQTELAARAGVSRQTVGAVEAGRHLPRVDAALALATTLGVDVEMLFASVAFPVDVVLGEPPRDGSLVRVGFVGERMVTAPARVGAGGWDVADARVIQDEVEILTRATPGLVIAGCEPGLEVLERILRERGKGALAATCSSKAAISSMAKGRTHAVVVHGAIGSVPTPAEGMDVRRYHLCRWAVGLAGPVDSTGRFFELALGGGVPVAQREEGAGVQLEFERIAGTNVPGPIVAGHLEAARLAVGAGMAGVTIEPAALAVGAGFHPLETHEAELWISGSWENDAITQNAMNEVVGQRFQQRLAGIGGYHLEEMGKKL